MRFLPLCALAAMSLLLAACLPESEHPVSAADPQHGDPRLWGAWINEAEDGFTVAHVLATEGGTLHLVTIDHDVEGVGGVDEYDGHVSRLKGGDYLNVRVTGSETGYLVAKYRFDGKDLTAVAHVVGTGGIVVHGRHPRKVFEAVLQGSAPSVLLKPRAPRLHLDSSYVLYAAGLLATVEPRAALKLLHRHLTPLGP